MNGCSISVQTHLAKMLDPGQFDYYTAIVAKNEGHVLRTAQHQIVNGGISCLRRTYEIRFPKFVG